MFMKKRFLICLLSLSVFCVCGCGADNEGEAVNEESVSESVQETIEEDNVVADTDVSGAFGSDFKKGCREVGDDIILTMQVGASMVTDLCYDYDGEYLTSMHVNYYCADEKTADDIYESLLDNEVVEQDSIERDGNNITYKNVDSMCEELRAKTREEVLTSIRSRAKQMGYE